MLKALVNVFCALNYGDLCGPEEEEISVVLGLSFARLGDLNGVNACLEFYENAELVSTNELIVVTNIHSLVGGCPTVGGVEYLLVSSTFVDGVGSATGYVILQTEVNCHLIDTSLFNGYVVEEVVVLALFYVYMTIGGLALNGVVLGFVPSHVAGAEVFYECVNCYNAFCSESLGESCCKEVYVVSAVAVVIEYGRNFYFFDYEIAVLALAILNDVLVVVIYVFTNGADAPLAILEALVDVLFAVYGLGYRGFNGIGYGISNGIGYRIGNGIGNGISYGIGNRISYRIGNRIGYRIGNGISYGIGNRISYRIGYGIGYGIGNRISYGIGNGIGCCRSCCFGSGSGFGSRSGFLFLTAKARSNGEHHSNGHSQGQNAQNVLFSHIENLH